MSTTTIKPTIFCQLTDKTAILILAFIGGYVDAFGYMNLEEIFTASITGNIVVASLSIVKDQHGMLARILTTVLFFFGGLFITLLLFQLRRCNHHQLNKHSLVIVAFCFEILCLLFALISGVVINYYGYNFDSIDSVQVIVMSSLLGFTMGIHNGATIEAIKDPPSTTVLTMTLVKLSISVANMLEHYVVKKSYSHNKLNHSIASDITVIADDDDPHLTQINQNYDLAFEKTITSIQPLIAFIIGAIVASGVNLKVTFPNLIIPIGLLMLLVGDIYRSNGSLSTAATAGAADDDTAPTRVSGLAELATCQTNATQFETQTTYEETTTAAAEVIDMDSQSNDSIIF